MGVPKRELYGSIVYGVAPMQFGSMQFRCLPISTCCEPKQKLEQPRHPMACAHDRESKIPPVPVPVPVPVHTLIRSSRRDSGGVPL
jgi:hypothetical protein